MNATQIHNEFSAWAINQGANNLGNVDSFISWVTNYLDAMNMSDADKQECRLILLRDEADLLRDEAFEMMSEGRYNWADPELQASETRMLADAERLDKLCAEANASHAA
ncbi:MAG: hypothetical protein ACR2P4_07550 [Gammaproteobacteria bacterium]